MKSPLPGQLAGPINHPQLLRGLAVILCAACAVVYLAIGLGLIYEQPEKGVRLWAFGFSAALAFALGVVLLLSSPGRRVLIGGVAFMALAIVAYLAVSPNRNPSFEIWGISLKIAQVAILVALLGLLARDRTSAPSAPTA
jgi:hypothetical protein